MEGTSCHNFTGKQSKQCWRIETKVKDSKRSMNGHESMNKHQSLQITVEINQYGHHCYVLVPLLELGEMPSCAVWWRATTVQAVATLLIIDTATLKWIVVSAFLDFFWPSQRCWLGFGVMLLPHGGIGLGSRWKEALTKENGLIMVNSFFVLICIQMLGFCCLDHAWMLMMLHVSAWTFLDLGRSSESTSVHSLKRFDLQGP